MLALVRDMVKRYPTHPGLQHQLGDMLLRSGKPTEARQAYDDNRRRNLLDDPLHTAQEIWQAYSSRILTTTTP